jgi:hypothetical protein
VLNLAPRHENVCRSRGIGPPFLTSALAGGEWSDSRPYRFTLGKTASGTHCIGWTRYRTGQDTTEKRKIAFPHLKSNFDPSAITVVSANIRIETWRSIVLQMCINDSDEPVDYIFRTEPWRWQKRVSFRNIGTYLPNYMASHPTRFSAVTHSNDSIIPTSRYYRPRQYVATHCVDHVGVLAKILFLWMKLERQPSRYLKVCLLESFINQR